MEIKNVYHAAIIKRVLYAVYFLLVSKICKDSFRYLLNSVVRTYYDVDNFRYDLREKNYKFVIHNLKIKS